MSSWSKNSFWRLDFIRVVFILLVWKENLVVKCPVIKPCKPGALAKLVWNSAREFCSCRKCLAWPENIPSSFDQFFIYMLLWLLPLISSAWLCQQSSWNRNSSVVRRSSSALRPSSVCGIDYLWSYCMDFFQILVVASPGPYLQMFFSFLKKNFF